ncbi:MULTISPECIES: hypothetical protein [Colwellia]|uniref:PEP-CTERM protein-sorting domain-containing protein n=1 Tax=Colwellia marinimaniae TaxID=1513592 RepID=A0ABQ0MPX8_9GAMM|nr:MULTISPECIES: hypothetical protein [Colwellia]GAW94424.1 hypothetical protein MTCD1_00020 [Colwellia marinimaniae]
MHKFAVMVISIITLVFSNISQATILPLNVNDLTADDYIVYNYGGVDYDIVWASKVNSEIWYTDKTYNFNTLFAPSFYENSGWGYAGEDGIPDLLTIFSGLLGSEVESLFLLNNSYVHAFSHWNSVFDEVINNNDILNKDIRSTWSWFAPDSDLTDISEKKLQHKNIMSTSGATYDTFYVRKTLTFIPAPKPIPEPLTITLFAIALIALQIKMSKKSA